MDKVNFVDEGLLDELNRFSREETRQNVKRKEERKGKYKSIGAKLFNEQKDWDYLNRLLPFDTMASMVDYIMQTAASHIIYLSKSMFLEACTNNDSGGEVTIVKTRLHKEYRICLFNDLKEALKARTGYDMNNDSLCLRLAIKMVAKYHRYKEEGKTKYPNSFHAEKSPPVPDKVRRRASPLVFGEIVGNFGIHLGPARECYFDLAKYLGCEKLKRMPYDIALSALADNLNMLEFDDVVETLEKAPEGSYSPYYMYYAYEHNMKDIEDIKGYIEKNFNMKFSVGKCVKIAVMIVAKNKESLDLASYKKDYGGG